MPEDCHVVRRLVLLSSVSVVINIALSTITMVSPTDSPRQRLERFSGDMESKGFVLGMKFQGRRIADVSLSETKRRKFFFNIDSKSQKTENRKLRLKVTYKGYTDGEAEEFVDCMVSKTVRDILDFNDHMVSYRKLLDSSPCPLYIKLDSVNSKIKELLNFKGNSPKQNTYDFYFYREGNQSDSSVESDKSDPASQLVDYSELDSVYTGLCKHYEYFTDQFEKFLNLDSNEVNTSQGYLTHTSYISFERLPVRKPNEGRHEKARGKLDLEKQLFLMNQILLCKDYMDICILSFGSTRKELEFRVSLKPDACLEDRIIPKSQSTRIIRLRDLFSVLDTKQGIEIASAKALIDGILNGNSRERIDSLIKPLQTSLMAIINNLFHLDGKLFDLMGLGRLLRMSPRKAFSDEAARQFYDLLTEQNLNKLQNSYFLESLKQMSLHNFKFFCEFNKSDQLISLFSQYTLKVKMSSLLKNVNIFSWDCNIDIIALKLILSDIQPFEETRLASIIRQCLASIELTLASIRTRKGKLIT